MAATSASSGSALQQRLERIRHVILILSGKGGVGKSSMAVQVALSLAQRGHRVGLLDADLCGPSIPRMTGLEGNEGIHQSADGWVPVFVDETQRLSVISIGFLLKSKEDAVIWRGPKKTAMIRQFLADVVWGDLDYLIIDTPPGTSDEHMTILECLKETKPTGAVLVTTPQGVALADVQRELNFCRKTELPILGVIENMSGFVCPHCTECTNIFSSGGGERLAEQYQVPFLGRVPLDPALTGSLEAGENFVTKFPTSGTFAAVDAIVAKLPPP